jgi:manganese-dependent inorganic pyrophosphatase
MTKDVYIIGHKNPDTDSVVSSAAYAALKNAKNANGAGKYRAVRAGNLNPQTEYILERFNVEPPEYLADLVPKVRHFLRGPSRTVGVNVTLQAALTQMQKDDLRLLPVVDELGVYKGSLHYRIFAGYLFSTVNPHKKSLFPVSIDSLLDTLAAQPIAVFNAAEARPSPIIVAASYRDAVKAHLEEFNAEDALVIMGDRFDLQRFCIERGVRALILTNGNTLSDELTALAEERHVSVISSPYDTSSTSMLIIYSVPAIAACDTTVPLLRLDDTISQIRSRLSEAPGRCLPVADNDDRVVGVLSESALFEEPNVEVIMVDHNETSQAIEGIEHFRLREVIDHHRLGNLSTHYPITFINKPVGATSTIITNLYREQRVAMRKEIASILLCAILSDTMALKSATTTDTDREAAEYLSRVTGLDVEAVAADLRDTMTKANSRSALELVTSDLKVYTEQDVSFSVSQIETASLDAMIQRKDEFLETLAKIRKERGLGFSCLLITDTTKLDSALAASGDAICREAGFPKLDNGLFLLKNVVSRKKQLIPLLSELVERLKKEGKL